MNINFKMRKLDIHLKTFNVGFHCSIRNCLLMKTQHLSTTATATNKKQIFVFILSLQIKIGTKRIFELITFTQNSHFQLINVSVCI